MDNDQVAPATKRQTIWQTNNDNI